MTKKALFLIFTILLASALGACGSSGNNSDNDPPVGSTACTDCKTFITANSSNGDLITEEGNTLANGILAADALCMVDANYPGTGTYKALIVDGTNRVACTTDNCASGGSTEHIDWVLHPNTNYFRSDGTTQIMTTNANGIFAFGALTNTFGAGSNAYWTGVEMLGAGWTTTAWHCANWTNGTGDPVAGMTGMENQAGISSIRARAPWCDDATNRLLCVEQ